ncbi:class I SAM-dependent methyltransferase [Sphaerotilus microaerophilus]|uniref:Methyltransferase type 12 n=1 Tax=Sphaerotilus microaerophilus TaxID=2914710 RepID=A0ABN6PIK9_9BURK|nr:SAM-dependent methyltransferase [Sphaerotilus sp. FB-5]BDI03282.1 methyltransferase type 12 [Sphaerotilus sp. FB-5]
MPGYLTQFHQIAVAGVADLQMRALLDRQQFADPLGEAAALGISDAAWPLFGLVWPAGKALAAAVADRPVREDEHILEIGCGLALASLVCHRRGAQVTASDCHPLAGAFLSENVRLNDLPPLRYRHGDWAAPQAAELAPVCAQGPRLQGRYDLIMGSDVLYERDEAGVLPRFIERHATERGEVLIVDPNRGNRAAFTRRMRTQGYRLDEVLLTGPALVEGGPLWRARLLRYRR